MISDVCAKSALALNSKGDAYWASPLLFNTLLFRLPLSKSHIFQEDML
ncbi:hypothetical protein Ga0466249_000595 [Sporomusaceae bacterium BoRhaA]|nr:hypothetical protein [Pelorhabdus rhamnosifermentans]